MAILKAFALFSLLYLLINPFLFYAVVYNLKIAMPKTKAKT